MRALSREKENMRWLKFGTSAPTLLNAACDAAGA